MKDEFDLEKWVMQTEMDEKRDDLLESIYFTEDNESVED